MGAAAAVTVDLRVLESAAPGQLEWAVSTADLPVHAVARLDVAFGWCDAGGTTRSGAGSIWIPRACDLRAPLVLATGYELQPDGAAALLAEGFVVATTAAPAPGAVTPGENPLSRGLGLDVAFLHGLRRAPFVDDACVFVAGGSAGGYMALMLAAETFPLAGAMTDVPVVNLGYTVAYWRANHAVAAAEHQVGTMRMPYLASLITLADEAVALYGDDTGADVFLTHSPAGHVDRITCPVSACFSTGDDLVPIEQVDRELTRVVDGSRLLVRHADLDLDLGHPATVTLIEALGADRVATATVAIRGKERRRLDDPAAMARAVKIPLPVGDRRWSVTILDEGPLDEDVPHYRYNIEPSHERFVSQHRRAPLALDQLDVPKLQLLADRWAGRGWMTGAPAQGDARDLEQEDVARGLHTWCDMSAAHTARLSDVLRAAPEAEAAFDGVLLRELGVR